MSDLPGERPEDLADFLALFASIDGHLEPEQLIYLRQQVWNLAHRRLPSDDALRLEMDSEDLAQDALLHLVQHVHEFRGATWSEFFAFVRTVIQQRRVDRARHRNRQKRQPDPAAAAAAVPGVGVAEPETPSAIAAAKEEKARLRHLIDGLPESFRRVLELRLDGRDYGEIAGEVGISEANARQRISRALGLLRERWRPGGGRA